MLKSVCIERNCTNRGVHLNVKFRRWICIFLGLTLTLTVSALYIVFCANRYLKKNNILLKCPSDLISAQSSECSNTFIDLFFSGKTKISLIEATRISCHTRNFLFWCRLKKFPRQLWKEKKRNKLQHMKHLCFTMQIPKIIKNIIYRPYSRNFSLLWSDGEIAGP